MTWRDRLQPASFRGVPFFVEGVDTTLGRRTVVHKRPGVPTPTVQDLGQDETRFDVNAYVIGPDYDFARDRLVEALLEGGPGQLVHPYRGTSDVEVTSEIRIREHKRTGGFASISFGCTVVVPELRFTPPARPDAKAALEQAALLAAAAAAADFENSFDVSGLPSGFSLSASAAILDVAAKVGDAHAQISAQLSVVSNVSGAINELTSNVTSLLSTPGQLASDVQGLIASSMAAVKVPTAVARRQVRSLLRSQDTVAGFADSYRDIPEHTPSRRQEAQNRAAITRLVRVTTAAEAATTTTAIPFPSRDLAEEASSRIAELVDDVAATAPDSLYEALVTMRAETVRHLAEVARSVPELSTFTPKQELPAVVLAHLLYGDARREAEIVDRNDVRYPGLLDPGEPLEVLSE